jgi:regulator of sirC expression with transglutaminase-like and TPR domain
MSKTCVAAFARRTLKSAAAARTAAAAVSLVTFPAPSPVAGGPPLHGPDGMAFDSDYRCDREFFKLLTRRSDVDLVAVSLEIARDADPQLDAAAVHEWIEQRAAEVRGPVARADSEAEALAELGRCIHETHGLTGGCAAFETADGSYLHKVIETKTGIPISLSILYMAVAARVGLDLKGVAAPRHFLTRYESADGPLFLDAYHGGRVLTLDECLRFLAGLTGHPRELLRPGLAPADARAIVARMLNNLKALYTKRGEWTAAWQVQHRLVALQPASYSERRDLALIALKAGRPGFALDLLNSCLASGPKDEQAELKAHLQAAQAQLCRWN